MAAAGLDYAAPRSGARHVARAGPEARDAPSESGVNRGRREHKGSFRGHPNTLGGGAVFS